MNNELTTERILEKRTLQEKMEVINKQITEGQKEKCFRCEREIIRKYVYGSSKFSNKNNWEFWTENEANKGKFMCNKCLLGIYYNDKEVYKEQVRSLKKRKRFTQYVSAGWIK